MRLRVKLGLNGTIRDFNWWKPVGSFPNLVSHAGKKWSWMSYDVDKSKQVDYILVFTEIPSYDPNSRATMDTLDSLTGDTGGSGCECGAIYDRHFSWDHMRFCRKWTKW